MMSRDNAERSGRKRRLGQLGPVAVVSAADVELDGFVGLKRLRRSQTADHAVRKGVEPIGVLKCEQNVLLAERDRDIQSPIRSTLR